MNESIVSTWPYSQTMSPPVRFVVGDVLESRMELNRAVGGATYDTLCAGTKVVVVEVRLPGIPFVARRPELRRHCQYRMVDPKDPTRGPAARDNANRVGGWWYEDWQCTRDWFALVKAGKKPKEAPNAS